MLSVYKLRVIYKLRCLFIIPLKVHFSTGSQSCLSSWLHIFTDNSTDCGHPDIFKSKFILILTFQTKLYHISTSAEGQLVVAEIAKRPLQQSMLNHNDCYCLDNGGQQVFAWKGKSASKEEKTGVMTKALKYMQAKGYGAHVNLEVVNDGAESAMFRSCFATWKDHFAVTGSKQAPKSNIAKVSDLK